MKPIWNEDRTLGVKLYKLDEILLKRARLLGKMLIELQQPEGVALRDAVDAILRKFSPEVETDESDGKETDESGGAVKEGDE